MRSLAVVLLAALLCACSTSRQRLPPPRVKIVYVERMPVVNEVDGVPVKPIIADTAPPVPDP